MNNMLTQLNLAIVGHANAGKTSLLRTITRDSRLGEVSDKPGATRHVEAITFKIEPDNKIIFYDTPGLEDSIALYDYVETLNQDDSKRDGVDKLRRFLSSPDAEYRFEQEAKVIRQLLNSDAAIYVIDVREPILDKYHDELAVLTYADKPILAVLNYTAFEQQYEEAWKKLLSRMGIHAVIRFDAVYPSIEGEERLYQSLSLLLEPAKPLLECWIQHIKQLQESRNNLANLIIAEALVDVTAYCEVVNQSDKTAIIAQMQNNVRNREQKAIAALLALYQFSIEQEDENTLPLVAGRFNQDLFNPEALKLMGIHLTKGIISGAAVGAGIDLAVGGITLGSAALIGATVGGLSQTAKHYGNKIKQKLLGYNKLTVEDEIICFLLLRLLQLKASLTLRGHANLSPIIVNKLDDSAWKKGKLPKNLQLVRVHAEWSVLNKKVKKYDERRENTIQAIANDL